MKKMRILIGVIITITRLNIKAQSSIRLMDLIVEPVVSINGQNYSDSYENKVGFKINKPENASQLVLRLGTDKGLSDVKEIIASITHVEGQDIINYNGQQYPIRNKEGAFLINITTAEMQSIKVYTFFIVDDQNEETVHYYLNK